MAAMRRYYPYSQFSLGLDLLTFYLSKTVSQSPCLCSDFQFVLVSRVQSNINLSFHKSRVIPIVRKQSNAEETTTQTQNKKTPENPGMCTIYDT